MSGFASLDFIEGQLYWVLTDTSHSLCINKGHFEDLKYLVLSHTTHRMDDGKKWYFENPIEDHGYTIIDEWGIDQWTFKSQDEFLKYLTIHVENLNTDRDGVKKPLYYFDDFVKSKIKESQERSPQLWI